MTYVLGINFAYHELSAVLIKDGQLVVAIEEERLNRIKHGKKALVDNSNTVPFASIDYCLRHAGITMSDVHSIATSMIPNKRFELITSVDPRTPKGDFHTLEGETLFNDGLLQVPGIIASHYSIDNIQDKFHWIPHHVGHAASTFLVSPYTESAIIVIDGIGEKATTWLGFGNGTEMKLIKEIFMPHSIGFLWEALSEYLGFSEYDACKVMGLASFGDPKVFLKEMDQLLQLRPDGEFHLDNNVIRHQIRDFEGLENLFRTKKLSSPQELERIHENIAAALQAKTDQVLLHLAEYVALKTDNCPNLCLAGGVALNCVSNSEILKSGLFKNIFIQPGAHDAGTALGAAFYVWNTMLGNPRSYTMTNCYTSGIWPEDEIEAQLAKNGVSFERVENIEEKTAKLLAKGNNIIGWYQGAMEFGPRALGNRSLLADPRNGEMKEILNLRIKKREPFRPFAPSVLEEDARDWFEIPENSYTMSKDFMLLAFSVKNNQADKIPAVVHVDNTSRIQTVRASTNPRYHKLISAFKKETGVPMVLNTSFNDNEPIVCSPADAIRTFQHTDMDYLAIHDYLCTKTTSS